MLVSFDYLIGGYFVMLELVFGLVTLGFYIRIVYEAYRSHSKR